MPIGQALSIQTNQVAATQPSARRAREHRSDNGATILPTSEYFVGLLRKVNRPDLVLQLLERASGTSFPELNALADAAKGKLPVESRRSIFHTVAKLAASVRHTIERAAERIMLLEDEYGAQAVQSLLDDECAPALPKVDRARLGYVIDYADLHFGEFRPFLIFNLADAAITIGVLMLLARALFVRDDSPETETK